MGRKSVKKRTSDQAIDWFEAFRDEPRRPDGRRRLLGVQSNADSFASFADEGPKPPVLGRPAPVPVTPPTSTSHTLRHRSRSAAAKLRSALEGSSSHFTLPLAGVLALVAVSFGLVAVWSLAGAGTVETAPAPIASTVPQEVSTPVATPPLATGAPPPPHEPTVSAPPEPPAPGSTPVATVAPPKQPADKPATDATPRPVPALDVTAARAGPPLSADLPVSLVSPPPPVPVPTPRATPDPAPPPAPEPTAPVDPSAAHRAAISELIRGYRDGYGLLDARAVQRVWPSVNVQALTRAFEQLAEQRFEFESCGTIALRGPLAEVSCVGQVIFVPTVGSRTPRVESRTWTFHLRRANDRWFIGSVVTR